MKLIKTGKTYLKIRNGIRRDRQLSHLKLSDHVYFFTPIFTTGYKTVRCSDKKGAIDQQIKFVQILSIRSYIYIEEQFILFQIPNLFLKTKFCFHLSFNQKKKYSVNIPTKPGNLKLLNLNYSCRQPRLPMRQFYG